MDGTGRILVRYSGTESLARVMIEGADDARIRVMADELAATIRTRDRRLMAVRGIGVDLVKIPRMREVIARWDERFLRRVFTDAGDRLLPRPRRDPVPHFAARFAAKEAGMKALGTGLRLGVKWRELEVRRERGQAPTLDPARPHARDRPGPRRPAHAAGADPRRRLRARPGHAGGR